MNNYIFVRYIEFSEENDEEAWRYLDNILLNDSETQMDVLDSSTWIMEEVIIPEN